MFVPKDRSISPPVFVNWRSPNLEHFLGPNVTCKGPDALSSVAYYNGDGVFDSFWEEGGAQIDVG